MYRTVQGTPSVPYSKYKLKKSVIDFNCFADFPQNWDFSRIFSPLIYNSANDIGRLREEEELGGLEFLNVP
jgi:hypothetical protein